MKHEKLSAALAAFNSKPDNSGVSVPVACEILERSPASVPRPVMLPFPSSFLRDLLAVPHERIAYEAGLRIAALRPGRAVLETDSSAFDFAEALERGAVDGRLVDMVPAQCLRRYYEATELSELVIENANHACAFEGCVVEVVTVTFLAGDCTETRHWVVAPDADIADRFFMRVCKGSIARAILW